MVIAIGGIAVAIRAPDPAFLRMLEDRYAGFVGDADAPAFEFDLDLIESAASAGDEDVRVFLEAGQWRLQRGDFRAVWDPLARRGRIRQSANPYSLDSVLRIVHTLVLAREGGFLLHAASAVRDGRAFLFAGRSGAGKTTIARLAPPDVHLLTDEISYVRREGDGYVAYGTPFAGELAQPGENLRAPVAAIYLLAHGSNTRVEPVNAADAARGLLQNILFFAEDPELVQTVFQAALDCAERLPVQRLTFVPDARVWDVVKTGC